MTITTTIIKTCSSKLHESPQIIKTPSKTNSPNVPYFGQNKFLFWEFGQPLKWANIIMIFFLHIASVYFFLSHDFINHFGIVIYSFILGGLGGFGVTGGAHRYFTHRTYKAKLPLRIILLVCYTLAGQNSLKEWVLDHRVHHKFSETDADPHNSKRGFFFSHVGWLMMKKHPEVIRKGKSVDISDLFEDPLVIYHQKYFAIWKTLIAFVIPTLISVYLIGESWYTSIAAVCFVRYMCNLNATWSVNSVAHIWGTKPYDKNICPVESMSVSFVAMGEGYHNYHHTFPWDYRTAELGSRLNVTTFWLNIFQKIGWAYDLKAASEDLVKKVVENNGDGSHYRWGHEVALEEDVKLE